ncbi:tyrosine-protein phosphatase [Kitasatospora sp. NPDC048407]|uniref:tyrosine-protein phosphatase n=1 Tax=Kitasatospora sp. NPDC048407 TaxID=3364051 RepID=UPI0037200D6E
MTSHTPAGSEPARPWQVLPGFHISSAATARTLPEQPATVLCLRRRPPQPGDYPATWAAPPATDIRHLPLPYWDETALPRLHQAVHTVQHSPHPVLAHCLLGLDRAGLLALAVLIARGDTPDQALARYTDRGVRLPDGQAMNLLTRYAHTLTERR